MNSLLDRMQWARSLFPHVDISQETAKSYAIEWLSIAEKVGEDRFDQGLREACRKSKFFPTVAEVSASCGIDPEKIADAEANQAFEAVMSFMRSYGTNPAVNRVCKGRDEKGNLIFEYPQLSERTERALRRVGGFEALMGTSPGDQNFRRDEFVAAYKDFEYLQNAPLTLADILRPALPQLQERGILAALPAPAQPSKETSACVREIEDAIKNAKAARDESDEAFNRRIEDAKDNYGSPKVKTAAELEEEKAKAVELAKRFTKQEEVA
jgi:hypothetical protein